MKTPIKMPPWSKRKRLLVAILATLLIGLLSILLGEMIYFTGRKANLIQSQSLKTVISETINQEMPQLTQDTSFIQKRSCPLESTTHTLWFNPEWALTAYPSSSYCSEFILSMSSLIVKTKVTFNPHAKDEVINLTLDSLVDVISSDYNHPQYVATKLNGFNNQSHQPQTYWLLSLSASSTLSVFYTGSSLDTDLLVGNFVDSLAVTD